MPGKKRRNAGYSEGLVYSVLMGDWGHGLLGREANVEIPVVGLKPVSDDSGVVEQGKEYLPINWT